MADTFFFEFHKFLYLRPSDVFTVAEPWRVLVAMLMMTANVKGLPASSFRCPIELSRSHLMVCFVLHCIVTTVRLAPKFHINYYNYNSWVCLGGLSRLVHIACGAFLTDYICPIAYFSAVQIFLYWLLKPY